MLPTISPRSAAANSSPRLVDQVDNLKTTTALATNEQSFPTIFSVASGDENHMLTPRAQSPRSPRLEPLATAPAVTTIDGGSIGLSAEFSLPPRSTKEVLKLLNELRSGQTHGEMTRVPSNPTKVATPKSSSPPMNSKSAHSGLVTINREEFNLEVSMSRQQSGAGHGDIIESLPGDVFSNGCASPLATGLMQANATPTKRDSKLMQSLQIPSAVVFGAKHTSSRTSRIDRLESSRTFGEATTNRDGDILSADESFASYCGIAKNELLGKNLIHLSHFESPEETMQAACNLSTFTVNQSWSAPLKSNRRFDVVATVSSAPPLTGRSALLTESASLPPSTKSKKAKESLRVTLVTVTTREYSHAHHQHVHALPDGHFGGSTGLAGSGGDCPIKPLTVLVIDDSFSTLRLTEHMLKKCNFVVQTELNPVSALARMKEAPRSFDVVIVDINMPVMDGLQLCHEYRQFESQQLSVGSGSRPGSFSAPSPVVAEVLVDTIPQIMLASTADFSATIVHEVMSAGFDGFLPKPFTIKQLNELLEAVEL